MTPVNCTTATVTLARATPVPATGPLALGLMVLALMGLGSLLFMISDYILTVDRFVILNNKWIVRSNSTFYFIGLLLIVLSMA